jgi:hypothetical protein
VAFLAVWGSKEMPLLDSDEECWTSLPAIIAGSRIQPFLEANDRVVALTAQGSESQIMSETNHAPSISVFRLEMMQLDRRGSFRVAGGH